MQNIQKSYKKNNSHVHFRKNCFKKIEILGLPFIKNKETLLIKIKFFCFLDVYTILCLIWTMEGSRYADQLYEDLMYFYNKNVRPVKNTSEPLRVKFGASLIRIIDVV